MGSRSPKIPQSINRLDIGCLIDEGDMVDNSREEICRSGAMDNGVEILRLVKGKTVLVFPREISIAPGVEGSSKTTSLYNK
jgi:hypothetical protein